MKAGRKQNVSPPLNLVTSFSPFFKEIRARAMAFSFLCFQLIGRGLSVGRCLVHISEQIEHVGKEEYPHVWG